MDVANPVEVQEKESKCSLSASKGGLYIKIPKKKAYSPLQRLSLIS